MAVGDRVRRQDGDLFVSGRATYTGDVQLPATAHLAVLRSAHAHARLLSVDCEPARSRPGVLAAIGGAELAADVGPLPPHFTAVPLGGKGGDVRCLAVEKARYVGEPLAAVVAETEADAIAALEAVAVEYEPLPAVLDAAAAAADNAPLLYDEWGDNAMLDGVIGAGTFEAGASGAAGRLSGRLEIPRTVAGPIETRTYLADWDPRRAHLTWYGGTQAPHQLRWVLASMLGQPERQVRVVTSTVGGSFGLKVHTHGEEILVAYLSRLIGRPVKWVEKREECMVLGGREQSHEYEAAYDADGTIRAVRVRTLVDQGALSAGVGWGMAFVSAMTLPNGYAVDHCEVHYKIVVTNKAPWSGVRGYGKEQAHLVMESLVDAVAARTGVDPAEVRRCNFIPADAFPHRTSAGYEIDSGNFEGLLDKVSEAFGYDEARTRREPPREGTAIGIGIGFELNPEGSSSPGMLIGGPQDSTTVKVHPTGEVTVLTGVTSPGTGNETGIAQIVAERLGLPVEAVDVQAGDTDVGPYGYGNMASRSLVMGGGAAALAADELAEKIRTVAARMLEAEGPEQIELAEGLATVRESPERALPIADVVYSIYTLPLILAIGLEPSLETTKTYGVPNLRHTPDEHGALQTFSVFSSALHMSMVEVDLETGKVTPLRHVVADDCGTVINPMFVEGQVQGSVVAGLGAALSEEGRYREDGKLVSDTFKTYLMPRADDLPEIEVLHQSTPSPVSALGAKGAGETGVGGAAAAVLNAVNDALAPLGARIERLPLLPPRVLAALTEAKAGDA